MKATLRFNPDETLLEAVTPDGTEFQSEWPEDGILILASEDGDDYLVCVSEEHGLDVNTVYRLVPVSTEVEEDVDITLDEEGDEEGDDDEGEPEPVKS